MKKNRTFDVIIIGGSYAGLSAAMALGRSLRSTLVIDSGEPCNAPTPHSHNFLTQDGKTPTEISTLARRQVEVYPSVRFIKGLAAKAEKSDNGFTVELNSGEAFLAKKLILATGIKDLIPSTPGFKECWGISVIHCPYCHGYEYRGKKTGLLAPIEKALHLAPLLKNLTNDITILGQEASEFPKEQLKTLHKRSIQIESSSISAIDHRDGYIQKVVFENGKEIPFSAIYAAIPFEQSSTIPKALGCEITEQGYIATDHFQKTTVEGVFACGDNSIPMRSVAQAVASGNISGAVANMELSQEAF